ncbi:MAG: DUF4193 family protein [Acidimicrobiales bacterium]|jgi:hypothetical protein
MRLAERNEKPEDHFTEGEPDLEPPEELALGELDDDTLLDDDLDNEDVAEEDVDAVVLEIALENLVHGADRDEDDERRDDAPFPALEELWTSLRTSEPASAQDSHPCTGDPEDLEKLDDLDVGDLEDADESLDRILADRLAGDAETMGEQDEEDESSTSAAPVLLHRAQYDGSEISPCRDDEFVCCSCFLVRKRAQLADPSSGICRDCSA